MLIREEKINSDAITINLNGNRYDIKINEVTIFNPFPHNFQKTQMQFNNLIAEKRYFLKMKGQNPQPQQSFIQPPIQPQPQPQTPIQQEPLNMSNGDDTMNSDLETPPMDDNLDDVSMDDTMSGDLGQDDMADGNLDTPNTDSDEDGEDSIESLAGKIMQKVRNYQEQDYSDKAKYAFNMILSGLNLEKMSDEDRHDIRKKFDKKFGDGDVF